MKYPSTQNAIVITGAGGPEVLELRELRVPKPGPQQVLIQVIAAGVNRHDCNQRAKGTHHDGNPVPGLEASGEIVAVGTEVQGLAPGDQVMTLLQGGGYAEYALAESPLVMPLPDGVTPTEAAGLPEALFTAWWNFFGLMKLQPGETVMIHGGTSGVGHLAIQALSALGYRVVATAGSAKKIAAAKSFGACAAFNYRDKGLADQVMAATDGAGIDALLDMSAGAHIENDLAMMATGGRIAHLSPGRGATLGLPLRELMAKRVAITGSLLRPLELALKVKTADLIRQDVLPLIGTQVKPTIAAVYPLSDAAQAHREMEKGRHIGKILLKVPE